jgi:hypothetical protein
MAAALRDEITNPGTKCDKGGCYKDYDISKAAANLAQQTYEKLPTSKRVPHRNTVILRQTECEDDQAVKVFMDLASRMMGCAGPRLLRLLLSEKKLRWRGGFQRGVPDTSRLAALATGLDDRVMAQRKVKAAPTTACMLLIDASGSMNIAYQPLMPDLGRFCSNLEGRLNVNTAATLAAAAFAQVVDKGGHRSKICTFTDCVGRKKYDDLRIDIVKNWSDSLRSSRRRFVQQGLYRGFAHMNGTPTAEAVWYAGKDLMSQDASRRVLFVFTDGEPDSLEHMATMLDGCEKAGIETVLVGLRCSYVLSQHHRSVFCDDLMKLSSVVTRELTKCLFKN